MGTEVIITNEHGEIELDQSLGNTLETLAKEIIAAELGRAAEVSVLFTNDERIQELNREYRQNDSATDVLSFPLYEYTAPGQIIIEPGDEAEGPLVLGDIVISLDTAWRQADLYGHSYSREISYLFVHGLLHLLGYDHLAEHDRLLMRAAEERYLVQAGLTRE